MILLNAGGLCKSYDGKTIFENVSFNIEKGDKIGLVGINGSGKTTLFRIMMGLEYPDKGDVSFSSEANPAYMEQHALADSPRSVYDEALSVFDALKELEIQLNETAAQIENGGDAEKLAKRQAELHERFAAARGYEYRSLTEGCLLGLGFKRSDFDLPVSALSGGQRTRVLLAKILLADSNVLLLDEPTNHLDIDSAMWLEDFLKNYRGAAVIISHDRYFLDKVTQKTFEMSQGKLTAYPGSYSKYLVLREAGLAAAEKAYSVSLAEIKRLEESAKTLHSFNREKSVRRAENIEKRIDRMNQELVKPEKQQMSLKFSFSPPSRGGREALRAKGLKKSFDNKNLFDNLEINLEYGDRAFIAGENGCGKTTLLKILLGKERADKGTVKFGSGLTLAYYEQTGLELLNGKDVLNEVWDEFPTLSTTEIRSALAAFLFCGEDVYKEISELSGGERARVALLKILLKRANFLLLDEPTNHLDIASREALESALESYTGTLICISHDRYFVNKLANCVYELNADGLTRYEGNFDAYIQQRGDKTAQKPTRAQSRNAADYYAKKEYDSAKRKAIAAAEKTEKEVERLELELKRKNDELFDENNCRNADKAAKISAEIEYTQKALDHALANWENAASALEKFID